MVPWLLWCRLCGNTETTLKIENSSEIQQIIYKILSYNSNDIKICKECLCFLNEINDFISKSKAIETMFVELLYSDTNLTDDEVNKIRERFGLKPDGSEDLDDSVPDNIQVKQEIEEIDDEDGIKFKNEVNFIDESQDTDDDEEKLNEELIDVKDVRQSSDTDESDYLPDDEYEAPGTFQTLIKKEKKRKYKKRKSDKKDDMVKDENFEYVCHICKLEVSSMTRLINHCKAQHNCSPQVRCLCGQIIGTHQLLISHKRRHALEPHLKCPQCKLTFVKQICLDKHIERKHSENAKQFVCSQCGGNYRDAYGLKKHEMTHLPDELKKTEECSYCGSRFVNKHSLAKHVNSAHTKKDWWVCATCGKSFTSKGNLRSHLVVHLPERCWACDQCDGKFKSKGALRAHKHVHGEKNIECPTCGTKFRSNAALALHKVIHSDEKKYKCTYCPNEYKRSDALKIHLNTHTGHKPFQCLFCDRAFNNNPNRRKHTLRDHPIELAAYEAQKAKNRELQQLQESNQIIPNPVNTNLSI